MATQSHSSRSSSSCVRFLHWAPKCPCGHGYMVLKTSHTPTNPGRKFWKCLYWKGENGCGMFLWKDETPMDDMEDVNSAVNRSSISYEEFHNLATKLERMETLLKSIDTKLDVKVESPHKLVVVVLIFCCIIFLAYMANPT